MDEFHDPQPHEAAKKSTVSAVLDFVAKKGLSLVHLLAGLLAAALILYSGYVLYDTFNTQNQAFSGGWDVLQFKPEIIEDGETPLEGQNRLAAINQDYRAWLTMYETNIDYPVMQGTNDLYYASHDIYGDASLTGAIYLAAGNTSDFTDAYNLIYGHHMDNGAMFGALDKYLEEQYIPPHKEGVLITTTAVYDLEVFAVIETDAYESKVYGVGPDRTVEEIIDFLENPTEKTTVSYYDKDTAKDAVKITALSTCAGATTNGRLVVYCKSVLRNLITIEIPSYEGIYDAETHTVEATVNYPEGTIIEYSVDGGVTWSEELPGILNVGTIHVIARATNDSYGRATAEATLIVHPRPVTVTAIDASKVYGTEDPLFGATVSGVIDGQEIKYTVTRPGVNTDENVGTYPEAIIPAGAEEQGNYIVTYVPADFTITPAPMTLTAIGYEGIYDAVTHEGGAQPSVTEGTLIEYSIDGGATWTTEVPSILNVGELPFTVRATNPNYVTATATATLIVHPRPVTVTANAASKVYGDPDPAFTATVNGLLGKDTVAYEITRPGAGTDEDVGTYPDAIVPAGEEKQGNYIVTYVPADFTITQAGVLVITGHDYEGYYDAAAHTAVATVNITNGTKIEYSTDGENWSRTAPSITDVGTLTVYARATNANYETVQTTMTLRVLPLPVTVTAAEATKVYGDDDPEFTAEVSGVIDGFEIVYTVSRPGAGTDEDVGVYENAIVPTGEAEQGNYIVTYVPANFTITQDLLTLSAQGYSGVYDAETHTVTVEVSVTEGTVLLYSTDGGQTWSETPPTIQNVGTVTVLIQATNPNYGTETVEVTLRITPRTAVVTAIDAGKNEGEDDPEFSATVTGVIDGFEIVYTVTRPGAGTDEAAGTYTDAIVPAGETLQGNYTVRYVPASFTITAPVVEPTAAPTPTPSPSTTPEPTSPIEYFNPKGTKERAWALINLLCMICTIYLLIPLLHLKDKYGRRKLMRQLEEAEPNEENREQIKKFTRRFRIGIGTEIVTTAGAILLFILTENMRDPMVLIDKWTPLMVIILIATWAVDFTLTRYRGEMMEDQEADAAKKAAKQAKKAKKAAK